MNIFPRIVFATIVLVIAVHCQEYNNEEGGEEEETPDGEDTPETPNGNPEEIHIGGLFESLEEPVAKAFQLAVQYVNDNELIPGKTLVADISEVPEFDSFIVGKTVCSLLGTGVAGIFGPTSPITSHHVQSLCDTLELPHIITRCDLGQRRSSCLLNLYPHHSALSRAIRDIVLAWEWKGFTVIYDDYDALRKIHGLLKLADDKGYLVTVRQLVDEGDGNYRKLLKEIRHSEEKNIVLECSLGILPEVLTQAQQVGLMGSGYNYIITTLDFHTIDWTPFMWAGTNITSIRMVNPDDPYVQKISSIWAKYMNESSSEEDRRDEETGEVEGTPEEGENEEENPQDEEKKRRKKRNIRRKRVKRQEVDTNGDIEYEEGDGEEENGEEENGVTEMTPTSSEMPPTEEPPTQDLPAPTLDFALMHDAVLLFTRALQYFGDINMKPIDCNDGTGLDFGYSLINFMKLSELQGMSGLIKFDHEGFRTDIELEVIELNEEGIHTKGFWNNSLTLVYDPEGAPPEELGDDLRNASFIVLIALTPPYNMLTIASKALLGNDRYEGFGVDLIHELSLLNGFNYTFKEQKDKSSGKPKSLTNGTRIWNGMIGEVMAGRADLAIADITITRERERDVDFTHPFMNLGIQILYRTPTKAQPELFSFLSPFSPEVWAYMMSAYIGVSLLFFVMARISPAEWTNPYPCIEEPEALENQFSLINSFWFTVGALMQQGSDVAPIGVSTRMAASIWWFFTLIMVSSYTANLAAFLTIETPQIRFKDIDGLVKVEGMKYGAKKDGSTAYFFRDTAEANPLHKKVWEFMEANPDVMMDSNEQGVDRVIREENYAFFMESSSIEYEIERKCQLTSVGGFLDNKGYGIVMRQNSTYRNTLSKTVVALQEKGMLTKLKNKWWKEKRGGGACSGEEGGTEATELNLANVGGVYVVLLGGCVFSIFITAFELIWDIYQREDKTSFKEELKKELKFIMKCKGTVKPLKEGSKSGSSQQSQARKRSRTSSKSSNSSLSYR